jgi:carboxyl-terminal processing protease
LQVNKSVTDALNAAYTDRTKFDKSLKKYISETEQLKKNLYQTRVSLNENVRKAEVDEAEKLKSEEKLDTKVTSKEGLTTDELLKLNDEYLREGLLILGDLVKKRIG